MSTKKRCLLVLGVALILVGLSSCHILDATVTFVQQLAGCKPLIFCSKVRLTLTSQDVPLHVVQLDLVLDAPQTVVMDSGNYVWNLPGEAIACTDVLTGTTAIAPGTSNKTLGCAGLF
jgi:hypothetical protein